MEVVSISSNSLQEGEYACFQQMSNYCLNFRTDTVYLLEYSCVACLCFTAGEAQPSEFGGTATP